MGHSSGMMASALAATVDTLIADLGRARYGGFPDCQTILMTDSATTLDTLAAGSPVATRTVEETPHLDHDRTFLGDDKVESDDS